MNAFSLPNHVMHEDQAAVQWNGTGNRLDRHTHFRSGTCRFTSHGRTRRQVSISRPASAQAMDGMAQYASWVEQQMAEFDFREAHVTMYALMRTRTMPAIEGYQQSYQGYWGTIDMANKPRTHFGGTQHNPPRFRRGIWEGWAESLATLSSWDRQWPIIFSPYCATALHEALGHAMEAEYLHSSPFKNTYGHQVSHEHLFVMDHPDVPNLPGTMSHDDSGRPASPTTLIHRGFVVGDLDHQRGIFRRGTFRHGPTIRATNLIIKPGPSDPASWMDAFPKCLYVSMIDRGSWLPGTKRIKLVTGPLYRLEYGQPTQMKPQAILQMDCDEILGRISAIGTDFQIDPIVHWCLKQGQSVPISMGAPSILLGAT